MENLLRIDESQLGQRSDEHWWPARS